ncbi:MAG TPA: bifunctional DNA-formamidopyrimidine glycosylase/DNA-(apurinic or apyrimidinic site) lyase [Candidatus Limnocylindrales bacterium]
MPELPEVETVARDLRRLVVGSRISGVRVSWERTLRGGETAAFADALAGRTIEAVGRRAKLIVVDLSGRVALTIHLKMTGQLFVVPLGTPPDPYVRVELVLDDGREIRFRDIRKFGRIGLHRRDPDTDQLVEIADGRAVFGGHGPEPLEDAFTVAVFRERLRGRRGRLKPLLLDQSFIAGVGNIYADEALWRARLHPLRSAASLRPHDERRLYSAIRAILGEAVERRGSSVDDYTAPEGDGSMQERLDVYQRTGLPCPRCGRPIRRIVVGGRGTHVCGWCQRLPAVDRRSAERILARSAASRGTPGRRWADLERARKAAATRRAVARANARATADAPADAQTDALADAQADEPLISGMAATPPATASAVGVERGR